MAYIADLSVRDERGKALETGLDRIMAGLQGFANLEENKQAREIAQKNANIDLRERAAKLADEQGGTADQWAQYLATGKIEQKAPEEFGTKQNALGELVTPSPRKLGKSEMRDIKEQQEIAKNYEDMVRSGWSMEEAAQKSGYTKKFNALPSPDLYAKIIQDEADKKLEKKIDRDLLRQAKQQQIEKGATLPDGTSQKPATAEQNKIAGFAMRADQAAKNMQDIAKKYDVTSAGAAIQRLGYFPEVLKSEDAKLQDQAERNFVNAVLRQESGAAIAQSEFDNAAKQYFPRVGDTPAVLAQKEQNRKTAIESLKQAGGAATKRLEKTVSNQEQPLPVSDQQINDFAKRSGISFESAKTIIMKRLGR